MPMIVDKSGTLFKPYQFNLEADFEACVVELADQIFGPDTIYIDKKKRVKGNDLITIPDGYVIDLTEPDQPKLFIVENEIVSHDPFKHIGIQMLKFATSFDDSRVPLRNFLMDEISKNKKQLERLNSGCQNSKSRNIDNYMDQTVYGEFRGLVVIDEARSELHSVLEKINANISVLELKTFESETGDRLYQFDTLYDEEEEGKPPGIKPPSMSPEAIKARRLRRAECDTVIVPAREEGFKTVFLGEDQWHEIRIGAAMKDRIKYIAAYQVAPVSAITHIAEVKEIRPYKDTGKYALIFRGPAREIKPIKLKDSRFSPQGPVYAKHEILLNASHLEEVLS